MRGITYCKKLLDILDAPVITLVFKLCYLALVFASFSSFTANKPLLSYIAYGLAGFGGILILVRILRYKQYIKMPLLLWLGLFVASAVVSSIAAASYGLLENVQSIVWMLMQFFLLYMIDLKRGVLDIKREFRIFAAVIVFYTACATIASLALAAIGWQTTEIEFWWYGKNVMGLFDNRLWGVYSDPNYAAVFCLISLMISMYCIQSLHMKRRAKDAGDDNKPWLRAVLIVLSWANIIIQVLYISLSGSRTGLVAAMASISAYILLILLSDERMRQRSLWIKLVSIPCVLCLSCSLIYAIDLGVSALYTKAAPSLHAFFGYDNTSRNFDPNGYAEDLTIYRSDGSIRSDEEMALLESIEYSENDPEVEQLAQKAQQSQSSGAGFEDRTDTNGDISTNRLDIWRSALDIFVKYPFIGTSHRNLLEIAQATVPNTFISTAGYSTLHNTFVDVLVSQGIVGILIFLVLVVSALRFIFLRIGHLPSEQTPYATLLFCCILAPATSMMFYTEVLYINTVGSVIFWVFLGYLVHLLYNTTQCSIARSDDNESCREEAATHI